MFFIVCFIGCFAVCLKCCPLLVILLPVTVVFSIILLAIGSLKGQFDRVIDGICDEIEDDAALFWQPVIDVPMCSDMCPCDDSAFSAGKYDELSADDLEDFERTVQPSIALAEKAGSQLMTQTNLENWITQGDFSDLTNTILTAGGGIADDDTKAGDYGGKAVTYTSGGTTT